MTSLGLSFRIHGQSFMWPLFCEVKKNLDLLEKIWSGWPANGSRFFQKTQKRRHVNNLDSPKKLLAKKNPAKRTKKTQKTNYGRHPM